MANLKPKILALGLLSLLNLILLVIAVTPPAKGYELSLYAPYTVYLFIAILLAFIFSFSLILSNIYKSKVDVSCFVGLFTIFMLTGILIFLPLIRGYFFYERSDSLSHIGMVKDILMTGHIASENFYPIFHIEFAIASIITDLNNLLLLHEAFTFALFATICNNGLPDSSGSY